MWRELISRLTAHEQPIGDLDPGPDFSPGATSAQLDAVEWELGVPLPAALRDLLEESNGVLVQFGQHLIWDTTELVQNNCPPWIVPDTWRNQQRLLLFGDAGVDGITFGFPITTDGLIREVVFA